MGTNDMYPSFSLQIKTAAKLFYKKLELADSFTPKLKLKSKVTLVKPTDNSAKLDEDYRLKEVRVTNRKCYLLSFTNLGFLTIYRFARNPSKCTQSRATIARSSSRINP